MSESWSRGHWTGSPAAQVTTGSSGSSRHAAQRHREGGDMTEDSPDGGHPCSSTLDPASSRRSAHRPIGPWASSGAAARSSRCELAPVLTAGGTRHLVVLIVPITQSGSGDLRLTGTVGSRPCGEGGSSRWCPRAPVSGLPLTAAPVRNSAGVGILQSVTHQWASERSAVSRVRRFLHRVPRAADVALLASGAMPGAEAVAAPLNIGGSFCAQRRRDCGTGIRSRRRGRGMAGLHEQGQCVELHRSAAQV